jgi:hypothetical protein
MKFILSMIICSSVAGQCMPPYKWPETFNTQYDCLMFGYEESIVKMKELGKKEVNEYGMFIKFYCTKDTSI